MMKSIFTILLFLVFLFPAFSQQDGVIDDPGDIAFVAYSDNQDGFSFLFLDDCPNGTVIQFTDKEWVNGSNSFDSASEGVVEWTNNTMATITKGTVVDITLINSSTDPGQSIGNAVMAENGFVASSTSDAFYAVIGGTISGGNLSNPTAFLSLVDIGQNVSLVGTGLTLGTNAVLINGEGYYMGSTTCNGTLMACLQMINNSTDWTTGSDYSFPSAVPNSFTGSVLPIELTYFKGQIKSNQIQITWGTATELENDYMSIERSSDGRIFKKIGQIQGAGTTFEAQAYSLMDKNPLSGLNYYRLRQVDFDGNEQVFSTIVVPFKSDENDIHFFPTQVEQSISIQLKEEINIDTQVEIFYLSGQKVMESIILAGDIALEMEVSHLVKGSYFARLTIGNEVITKRFIKM